MILCSLAVLSGAQALETKTTALTTHAEIEVFNRAFDDATRRMDNAAAVALWEADGISLLPSTKPIVGKKVQRFWRTLEGSNLAAGIPEVIG